MSTLQEHTSEFPATGTSDPAKIDSAQVEAFAERVLGDLAATMTTTLCVLGDRLGLFRALAEGPATSEVLARRSGLVERYVREWARGLTAAGYLQHDPHTGRFALPLEHAAVLADEGGPAFLAGGHQMVRGLLAVLDPVEEAFRRGGGVPLSAYGDHFWDGLARVTTPAFEHLLVPVWIPAVDGLEARLRRGARMADIGCGTGRAAIKLAQHFPKLEVTGYDLHAPNLEGARLAAQQAGVGDRVRFEQHDATRGLPERYDVISFFDVLHDSEPLALLKAAREALSPEGYCLALELNCHAALQDNQGAVGSLLYGISVLHCTTQALAADCTALGTCGLPEPRLRQLASDAGFSRLVRAAEQPLDVLYAMRP